MPSTSSPLARSTPMPSVNLSPRATGGPIDPFDTVDEPEFSEFSELALLPYLAGIPYPTYLLPSPRLSSSSEPSLSALWSNDSAQELGPDLNAILPYRDSRRLKALIASSDQADDEQWATSEANEKHETTSLASFSSFVLASQNTIELDVILPRWSKRRPYSATLQPSAHPSFFVLLLVPAKARNPKPKSFLDTSHSLASSIVDPAETFLAVDSSTAELGGEDESGTSGGKAQPAVSVPLEWTSLRDQGPVTKVLEEFDYHWSYREAEARMDWSRTPIGYPKQWHPTLRTMMNCIETMPDLGAIWWFLPDQDDWFMLHNSVYETALRNPTGAHFGRYASDSWGGENWETLKARAHECQNSGQGIYTDDDAFYLNSIETYMSWRWSPIIGPKGEKLGILVTAFIDTQKVIARRYLETSRTLASNLASSRSIQELSEGLLKSLELNERDFPYAMLYHLRTETATGKKCDLTTEGTVFLAGSVGLPFDHSICPRQAVLNLSTNSSPSGTESAARWPLASALEEAFHSENPIRLTELAVEVPEDMRQRSWGDIPYSAMVYKISNLGESSGRCSFLVLGMNPRRPFDSQYSNWLDAIQRHILLTYRNISYLEDEKRKRAELASLDQAKTNFFASASHELRTPLQLILGPLTELENSETTATRKGYFALIQRSGARLMRLVDSILDFSKMESGQLNGHFSPRNLGILSGDVAEVFRSSIEKARIEFNVSCARESDKLVYIDTSFWEKICYNLIGNAFKYTLKGSIEVSCTYHPDEFEFRVTDTGVGIPKSDLGKVTERFHRVQSVSRSVEGTGIGLALCAELVQLLGGRLEIESSTAAESPTNESGSVFSVFLPYGKGHLPEGQIDDDENREAYLCSDYSRGLLEEASRWAGRGANTSGSSGTAATSLSDSGVSTSESSKVDLNTLFWAQNDVILLVDDSQDLLEYLSTILARHCKIIQASNGEEAVKVLQKQSVNLVVSDVQMPTMDGYALLAAIRAHKDPERAITPVILISARAGEEERVGGLLAGADDFLPKPFSAKELVARCHLQVQLGKKRLELERNFRAESATTRLLSDLSPVGISRWNPDGLPVYANPAWYKQSGHPPDASLASWMDSVHPDHHSVMHKMSEQLFDKKAAVEGEWMWTNGTWSYCQAVIIDKHSNSNYEGMICVLTDITERKKYETERKIAVAAEEAHLRHRAEFAEEKKREADEQKRHQEFLVSVVSHEVRNPVSAILQCAGLCRANLSFFRNELATSLQSSQPFEPTSELVNLLDEDIETLDNVTETALLIERIANDFLSLGKIQLATLEIFATPCDLSAEVRKLLGVFASEARLKGIHIALDLKGQLGDPNGQHIFLTDPVRLGQVVINLLSNAIRFTSASERREISVALEVSASPPSSDNCKAPVSSKPFTPGGKSYIYGAVTDSGPGLAPESLSILFQRFQQASSSTHTVFGGSGLGLYVCRLITGLMNGRIEVDSVKGEGSTFRFFIECMTPDEAGDIAQTVDVKPIVIQFPHVLVVEDNLINARVIERQLKKAGMTCSVTYDGQQGLDAVVKSFEPGEKRFNCILMDCEMPVMDGVTAVKHIRRLEAEGSLPTRSKIFALTGNARQGQIDDALKAGMDDVVLKPYKVDLLLEKLRTFSQLV